jgi:hypothetical protein
VSWSFIALKIPFFKVVFELPESESLGASAVLEDDPFVLPS